MTTAIPKVLLACAACLLVATATANAAPPPSTTENAPLYQDGLRALAEGLPQVAVDKLRALLASQPAIELRRATVLALTRALLGAPDATSAQELLERERAIFPAGDTSLAFWRGQVKAALGKWPQALESYDAATHTNDSDLAAHARFGQGTALLALGRGADAAAVFRGLRDHPVLGEAARMRFAEIALDTGHLKEASSALLDHNGQAVSGERAYLVGRLRLAERQPSLAVQIFTGALAHPEGLTERLMVDCYWGWAQACLDQDNVESARDALENLIERYPRSTFLPQTFTWLARLYARERTPDLSVPRRWSQDAAEPYREALARLSLGQLEEQAGHAERAEEILEAFPAEFPEQTLRARALLDLAALRLRLGRPADARHALDLAEPLMESATALNWRTDLDVLKARISLAENDGPGAARRYEAVAERLSKGPQAEAAAFDAVVGWLRAKDATQFAAAEQTFRAQFPQSTLSTEFELEEGLTRAAQSRPGDTSERQHAAERLRDFLHAHPSHPRVAEARLALAELAYERPSIPAAWRELHEPELLPISNDGVATPGDGASPAERDRAQYLEIWLTDSPDGPRDPERAIALAKKFLTERPNSALAAQTRMKLGEIYFQREDYPDAQTQLELLAENAPDSPLVESALYLAGMSAVLSASPAGLEKAVALFERAARRDGPFKLRARLQQADVQNRLGKGHDALFLYDAVLAATNGATPLDADEREERCAALCGRGQTLLSLAASGEANDAPRHNREAVQAFDQLASLPGASLLWRRQALTLKGHALEKLSENDAALAAYDDALNAAEPTPVASDGGTTAPTPEWTWFYRAGHDAAALLEKRAQWQSAIAIYEKLAAADGPMKSEFENLLRRRRLEHFIW